DPLCHGRAAARAPSGLSRRWFSGRAPLRGRAAAGGLARSPPRVRHSSPAGKAAWRELREPDPRGAPGRLAYPPAPPLAPRAPTPALAPAPPDTLASVARDSR